VAIGRCYVLSRADPGGAVPRLGHAEIWQSPFGERPDPLDTRERQANRPYARRRPSSSRASCSLVSAIFAATSLRSSSLAAISSAIAAAVSAIPQIHIVRNRGPTMRKMASWGKPPSEMPSALALLSTSRLTPRKAAFAEPRSGNPNKGRASTIPACSSNFASRRKAGTQTRISQSKAIPAF
jgi:hypothetical protein